MARIKKTEDNIVPIPPNVSVANGYVMLNITTTWVKGKDGKRGHASHEKVAIGKTVVPPGGDWKADRRMYANATYLEMLRREKEKADFKRLPRNVRSDEIQIGAFLVIQKLCEESGLALALETVFGRDMACQILDHAQFMLLENCADLDYFPEWARRNAVFSSAFGDEREDQVKIPRILRFQSVWADRAVFKTGESEQVFLCPNRTCLVRWNDFVPVALSDSLNRSFIDEFIQKLGEKLTVVCEREGDLKGLEEAGVHFLTRLPEDLDVSRKLSDEYGYQVRSARILDDSSGLRGMTVCQCLPKCRNPGFFHIFYDPAMSSSRDLEFKEKLLEQELTLRQIMDENIPVTWDDIENYLQFFHLGIRKSDALQDPGARPLYHVTEYQKDEDKIQTCIDRLGIFVLAGDRRMGLSAALEAYTRCIQAGETSKLLRKSGTRTGFVAWIMGALVRERTAGTDEKDLTVIFRTLQDITADRSLRTDRYEVRYQLTPFQRELLEAAGVSEKMMDDCASGLSHHSFG